MGTESEPRKVGTGSGRLGKILIVVVLAVVVGMVVISKNQQSAADVEPANAAARASGSAESASRTGSDPENNGAGTSQLPRLVDLGAGKCIPCKMMAPILEDLKTDFEGQLEVVFIDVWENRDAGEPYGIKVIPTQIFFDASGKEFFRHEGFFSRDDILKKFKEQGIDLES